MAMTRKVRCIQCQHYYITWDKRHPYGCKKLGFKAAIEPALVVRRASGQHCLAFEPKPPHQRS
jgi:hypothetical protein